MDGMDLIQLVPERNLLPAIGLAVLLVFGFLYVNSDSSKRGAILMAAMILVGSMFLLTWVF